MVRGEFIWRQFEKLTDKGFHEAAGFTKKEFESLIPEPKNESGLLVVSETCLNLCLQADLLNISNRLPDGDIALSNHRNLVEVPRGFLYWIYDVDDGRVTIKLSHEATLALFKESGRDPCTTAEVFAIVRENPEVLFGERGHGIDAAGSLVGANLMPGICLVDEMEKRHGALKKTIILMASDPNANGFDRWGAASCKK